MSRQARGLPLGLTIQAGDYRTGEVVLDSTVQERVVVANSSSKHGSIHLLLAGGTGNRNNTVRNNTKLYKRFERATFSKELIVCY